MTINEIRALADPPLQPLPEPMGNTILGANSSQGTSGTQSGGNPLADEVRASSHAVLLTAIKGIVNRCLIGETSRKQALEEASRLIADHISAERGRAQAYIRARTGVQTAGTTPEMEAEFYRIQEEYLSDFERILDDALKAGGLVE
jgi:hypothetical protein